MLNTFAFVCIDMCKIQNARLLLMLQLVYFSMALSSFHGYRSFDIGIWNIFLRLALCFKSINKIFLWLEAVKKVVLICNIKEYGL